MIPVSLRALSRGRTLSRMRLDRVSGRGAREAFIRRDTCVTMCGTARAPSLGGILLSVRVSRKDDNAHGIAVASFSTQCLIASAPMRGRGIVVSRADSPGNAHCRALTVSVCVPLQRLTTECHYIDLIYVLRMVPIRVTVIGELLAPSSRSKVYQRY